MGGFDLIMEPRSEAHSISTTQFGFEQVYHPAPTDLDNLLAAPIACFTYWQWPFEQRIRARQIR